MAAGGPADALRVIPIEARRWDREFVMGTPEMSKWNKTPINEEILLTRPHSEMTIITGSRQVDEIDIGSDSLRIGKVHNEFDLRPDYQEKVERQGPGLYERPTEKNNGRDTGQILVLKNFEYFKEIKLGWDRQGEIVLFEVRDANDKIHEIRGSQYECEQSRPDYHERKASGNLMITGFYLKGDTPIALQVVDLYKPPRDNWLQNVLNYNKTNSLLAVYRMFKTQGIYTAINKRKTIDARQMVGVSDESVLELFQTSVEKCLPMRGNRNPKEIYIEFITILEKAIDGDLHVMHSVFALNRYINHLISDQLQFALMQLTPKFGAFSSGASDIKGFAGNKCTTSMFLEAVMDDGLGALPEAGKWETPINKELRSALLGHTDNGTTKKLIFKAICKLQPWWCELSKVLEFAKRINHHTPTIDVFTLTYLDPSWWNWFTVLITFITQIGMTILIILSLDFDEYEFEWLPVISSLLISCTVIILAKKQIVGVKQFLAVFPEASTSPVMLMSIISNVLVAALIVPLNSIIIAVTEEKFDIVLNALAILFILELDDMIVDVNPTDEKSLYLSYLQEKLSDSVAPIMVRSHFNPQTTIRMMTSAGLLH